MLWLVFILYFLSLASAVSTVNGTTHPWPLDGRLSAVYYFCLLVVLLLLAAQRLQALKADMSVWRFWSSKLQSPCKRHLFTLGYTAVPHTANCTCTHTNMHRHKHAQT